MRRRRCLKLLRRGVRQMMWLLSNGACVLLWLKTWDPLKNELFLGRRRKSAFYGVEGSTTELPGVSIGLTEAPTQSPSEASRPKIQPIDMNKLPVGSFTPHSRHTDQKQNSVKQIRANRRCPNKFRIIARVVDYFPLDISQFTWRRCAKCRKRRAIFSCGH